MYYQKGFIVDNVAQVLWLIAYMFETVVIKVRVTSTNNQLTPPSLPRQVVDSGWAGRQACITLADPLGSWWVHIHFCFNTFFLLTIISGCKVDQILISIMIFMFKQLMNVIGGCWKCTLCQQNTALCVSHSTFLHCGAWGYLSAPDCSEVLYITDCQTKVSCLPQQKTTSSAQQSVTKCSMMNAKQCSGC